MRKQPESPEFTLPDSSFATAGAGRKRATIGPARMFACALAVLVAAVGVAGVRAQDAVPVKKSLIDRKKERDKTKDEVIRLTGRLTSTDPPDKHRGGCFHKVHDVKLKPGKTYIIDLLDRNAFNMDPYLRLENSKGERLKNETGRFLEDDDGGGGLNSRLAFTPTVEDTYRVIATTCSSGRTGEYGIVITPVPVGTPMPTPGQGISLLVPIEVGDIVITPHAPWGAPATGNSNETTHGYVEYRFTVENYSETDSHHVQLRLPRYNRGFIGGHFLQAIKRAVEIGPQEMVEISLFQPDLPLLGGNDAEVVIDGRDQDQGVPIQMLTNRGSRINRHFGMGGPPSSFSQTQVLTGPGLNVLEQHVFKSAVGVHDSPIIGSHSTSSGEYQVAGPYFGKRWVYSSTNRFTNSNRPLFEWSTNWLGYTSYDGIALTGEQLRTAPPEVQKAIWQFTETGGALLIVGACKLPEGWERTRHHGKYFTTYHPGFGECIVTGAYPLDQWDPDAWREITGSWAKGDKAWSQLRTATDAHREFPVVEDLGIPVRGLFLFMVLFVVFIGPVNLYWLTRTRRRIWLLWTVPVASLATCAVLFGYMMLSEGWHGHIRSTSVTVLDETSQRAATVGWLGHYSPVNVGDGFRFSDDTEITPHLLRDRIYRRSNNPRSIDWTHGQHLDSGWIDAKVPAHFMVRRNERRLERMLTRKHGDGSISLVNGLPSDLSAIWLASLDGGLWTATNVRAGAEVKLQRLEGNVKAAPGVLREGFGKSWLELAKAMENSPADYLLPGCYLAVADDAPFLEPGVEQTQSRNLRSIVYGILKEPQ